MITTSDNSEEDEEEDDWYSLLYDQEPELESIRVALDSYPSPHNLELSNPNFATKNITEIH